MDEIVVQSDPKYCCVKSLMDWIPSYSDQKLKCDCADFLTSKYYDELEYKVDDKRIHMLAFYEAHYDKEEADNIVECNVVQNTNYMYKKIQNMHIFIFTPFKWFVPGTFCMTYPKNFGVIKVWGEIKEKYKYACKPELKEDDFHFFMKGVF